jgi:DNA-binding CsgD family transcriptional regulator/tetratricopeptide (TPR) repeat protein
MSAYFFGREQELETLLRSLECSARGEGRVIALCGDVGIGKTRLMTEIARIAGIRGFLVLWGQLSEDPARPPYTPWVLALRECFSGYADELLRSDLGDAAADISDIVPELKRRLDLPAHQPLSGREAARYQLFDSVSCFLRAASRRQPLLILFDNLHLADPSSLALLAHCAHGLPAARIAIVAAYRSGDRLSTNALQGTLDRIARTVSYQRLELHGLSRDAVAELLHAYVGRSLPPSIVDGVHAQSDGNPLFIGEVGSLLAARTRVPRGRETWHRFRVPNSLRDLVEARLSALPDRCLRLLGVAAVLGRQFDAAALAAMSQSSTTSVLRVLAHAETSGVISPAMPGEFRFHHALFREVLYDGHSTMKRLLLHRRAGEYLAGRVGRGQSLGDLCQIAYHYYEAAQREDADPAIDYCVRAGDSALEQRAYTEAAIQFQRALQIMEVGYSADPLQKFSLLQKHGLAQYRSGQVEAATETLLERAVLAHHHHWWERLAGALCEFQLIRGSFGVGHIAAVPLHEEALRQLPEDLAPLRARLLGSFSVALTQAGRRERACATARQAIALARATGDTATLARCLSIADWALADPMTAAERLQIAREALELAEFDGRAEARMESLKAMIIALGDAGLVSEAESHLIFLRSAAQAERHPHYLNLVSGFETAFAIMRGRWDDALTLAVAGQSNAARHGVLGLEGRFGFHMFAIHKARGSLPALARVLSHIVCAADQSRLWLPGLILMHCELGQLDEARAALSRLPDPSQLPRDDLYLTILVYLSEACARIGDRAWCARLYELLWPFRRLNASLCGTMFHGAVAGYLAPLAVVMRRQREARTLYEAALTMNSAMGAAVALTESKVGFATLLMASERPEDHKRAADLLAAAQTAAMSLGLGSILQRIESVDGGAARDNLTERELQVLLRIVDGASNQQIADALFVSHSTVATHVRSILRKTNSANRTEAAAYARRCGLVAG